jgi:hypothetical protein
VSAKPRRACISDLRPTRRRQSRAAQSPSGAAEGSLSLARTDRPHAGEYRRQFEIGNRMPRCSGPAIASLREGITYSRCLPAPAAATRSGGNDGSFASLGTGQLPLDAAGVLNRAAKPLLYVVPDITVRHRSESIGLSVVAKSWQSTAPPIAWTASLMRNNFDPKYVARHAVVQRVREANEHKSSQHCTGLGPTLRPFKQQVSGASFLSRNARPSPALVIRPDVRSMERLGDIVCLEEGLNGLNHGLGLEDNAQIDHLLLLRHRLSLCGDWNSDDLIELRSKEHCRNNPDE